MTLCYHELHDASNLIRALRLLEKMMDMQFSFYSRGVGASRSPWWQVPQWAPPLPQLTASRLQHPSSWHLCGQSSLADSSPGAK